MLEVGLKHTSELIVSDALTAIQMGSGDMPVLATPAMMALMENAAMLAVADELPEGKQSDQGRAPSTYRGMRIVYSYDDGFHDDFNVSEELQIEYYD